MFLNSSLTSAALLIFSTLKYLPSMVLKLKLTVLKSVLLLLTALIRLLLILMIKLMNIFLKLMTIFLPSMTLKKLNLKRSLIWLNLEKFNILLLKKKWLRIIFLSFVSLILILKLWKIIPTLNLVTISNLWLTLNTNLLLILMPLIKPMMLAFLNLCLTNFFQTTI